MLNRYIFHKMLCSSELYILYTRSSSLKRNRLFAFSMLFYRLHKVIELIDLLITQFRQLTLVNLFADPRITFDLLGIHLPLGQEANLARCELVFDSV